MNIKIPKDKLAKGFTSVVVTREMSPNYVVSYHKTFQRAVRASEKASLLLPLDIKQGLRIGTLEAI